jgi:putative flippase GtrA
LSGSGLRYLVVAGTCALLHNVVLIGFDAVEIDYVTACVVSFVLVATVGYLLHSRFTFPETPTVAGMVRYSWAMSANLPLSIVAIFVLHTLIELPMVVAAPLSVVILVSVNYALTRWAILGHWGATAREPS